MEWDVYYVALSGHCCQVKEDLPKRLSKLNSNEPPQSQNPNTTKMNETEFPYKTDLDAEKDYLINVISKIGK